MSKTPVRAEIVENNEGRYVVLSYADGSQKRLPVDRSIRPKRTPREPPARVHLKDLRRTGGE
jgi:hypothetical protein